MIGPGVIGYLILNDFNSKAVSCIDELAQLREGSEVFFDAVEVNGAVSVIIGDRLLGSAGPVGILLELVQVIDVVVPRCKPDGRDAEALQIRQMVDYALDVAAVIVAGLRSVIESPRGYRVVVGRIPVREAVRHDEVNHVIGVEALKATLARKRRGDLERRLGCAHRRCDAQSPATRCCIRVDLHINENIGSQRVNSREPGLDSEAGGFHSRVCKVASSNHHAHRIDRMMRPPVRGFDF